MTTITGYLYNPLGEIVTYGVVHITLQQDMTSIEGDRVAPFTVDVDLAVTGGFVNVSLYPTIGASPSGLSYRVEFDADPNDTTKPIKNKDGYWRNYWAVPNTGSVTLGSFLSALRGQPAANYMPVGGTVSAVGDTITLGTGSATTKHIVANQVGAIDPEIRYNVSTARWEFSDNGTSFQALLQGGGGSVGGDLSGTVGSATVVRIRGWDVSATAPSVTGQFLRWNNGTSQYEPSLDGSQFTNISAANIGTGTIPLSRLSGITNNEISSSANISWTKISKAGSSLADLATRSAADLNSGTLPLGRLSGITNTEISASAAIDATKIGTGVVSNAELAFVNNLNQQLGTTDTPNWARAGFGGAADSSAVAKFTGQFFGAEFDAGNSGTAITLNWNNGNDQYLTLTGNCTISASNPKGRARYLMALRQDGTGGRTVTWPANFIWSGGVAPTLTTTAGRVDLVAAIYSAVLDRYFAAYHGNFTP